MNAIEGSELSFFAELQRRNVIKVAVFYLVASWLIIQVAETVLPLFEVPDGFLRGIVILMALGFLPALILSWIYELTPEGVKRESEIDRERSITPQTGRKLNQATVVVAGLAIALMAYDRLVPRSDVQAPPEQPAPTPAPVADESVSIAVLPFVNMSASQDQEYFSDGMTEEIINALVKLPDLSVAARTSVFAFKDHSGDIRSVGEQLGVNHILEGSVRSDGANVRITAQLIRVDNGFHLWSDTYDRELTSVFVIQDEIARAIADQLAINLTGAVDSVPNRTQSMDAYDLYLKGRRALRERDLGRASDWLRQATEADPGFVPAWAALALSLQIDADWIDGVDQAKRFDPAEQAARRALALDPDNVEALTALASIHRDRYQWREAQAVFDQALAADPQNSELLEDYAEFLGAVGRFEEMLEIAEQGYRVDPLLMPLIDVYLSALILNGRMAEARQLAESEDFSFGWARALEIYLQQGELDLAIRALQQARSQMPAEFAEFADGLGDLIALLQHPDDEAALQRTIQFYANNRFLGLHRHTLLHLGLHESVLEVDLESMESGKQRGHELDWLPGHERYRALPQFARTLEFRNLPQYWDETGWPDICRRDDAGSISCE